MTSAPTPSAAASEGARRSPQEPLAAPVSLRLAALLAALAGHAGMLYWVARKAPDPLAGAHGQLLAAVNVTVVSPGVLEAREARSLPPAPAVAKSVEAQDGALQSAPRPSSAERKEERAEATQTLKEPVPDGAIGKLPRPKAEKQEAERREASPAVVTLGAASARGDALTATKQSAPAAARAGVVRAYANAVAEALERTKPKRVPAYGTIRIKLIVSTDGKLASVEILKSSGNRRLDNTMLAVVRRTRFPTPPPGLALEERWFVHTYEYVR